MQFRSYTYDATEVEIQYALDSRGQEIREVQLDEAYTGVCFLFLFLFLLLFILCACITVF